MVPDSILNLKVPSSEIRLKDGRTIRGKYLHRMVIFSFGDRNGQPYNPNLVIDHVDMNHANNSVWNLDQISYGLNLFRAYYLTRSDGTSKKFKDYYNSLDEIDKKLLDLEIGVDLAMRKVRR